MRSEQGKQQRKPSTRKAIDRYVDFETKKSIHINLTKRTHAEFRKILFDLDLSMQEVFEKFADLAATEDSRAISVMKEAKSDKRAKVLKGIDKLESESLYDAISEIDPFA
jgi:hypothetical protein